MCRSISGHDAGVPEPDRAAQPRVVVQRQHARLTGRAGAAAGQRRRLVALDLDRTPVALLDHQAAGRRRSRRRWWRRGSGRRAPSRSTRPAAAPRAAPARGSRRGPIAPSENPISDSTSRRVASKPVERAPVGKPIWTRGASSPRRRAASLLVACGSAVHAGRLRSVVAAGAVLARERRRPVADVGGDARERAGGDVRLGAVAAEAPAHGQRRRLLDAVHLLDRRRGSAGRRRRRRRAGCG